MNNNYNPNLAQIQEDLGMKLDFFYISIYLFLILALDISIKSYIKTF